MSTKRRSVWERCTEIVERWRIRRIRRKIELLQQRLTAFQPSESTPCSCSFEVERDFYAQIVSSVQEGIVVYDPTLRYVYWNPYIEEFTGCPASEVAGKYPWEVFPSLDKERVLTALEKALQGEAVTTPDMAYFLPRLNEVRYASSIHTPLRNAEGAIVGVVSTIRDIQDRRQIENELLEAKSFTEQIIAGAGEGVIVYDSEFRYRIWNPFMERITSLPVAEVIGKRAVDVFPHIHQEGVYRYLERALAGETVTSPDTPYQIPKTGKSGWVIGTYAPHRNRDGVIIGVIGMVHDITDRKRAEEALMESQDMLQLILNSIPQYVFWKDTDSIFLGCNVAFANAYGIASPDDIVGKSDRALVEPEELRTSYLDNDREVIKTRQPKTHILEQMRHASGDMRWVSTTKTPLINQEGKVIGLVGVSEDVTEQRKAEEVQKKLELKIQQTQKLESLGILAGGIAHDFNNLLMAILGNADLAMMDISTVSPARPMIMEIEQTTRKAADLCKQMLAYSGKGKFIISQINLSEVVKEMGHMLEVSISKKVVLRYNLMKSLPGIEADVTQIRQVIMNLIINASEAIGNKSGVVSLTTGYIECDKGYLTDTHLDEDLVEGPYVFLEVGDTGSGMDADTVQRIFDPFFTTKFTGRGLGLAAVLGIVRGHNGAIKVYSESGKGTTFKLLFPALGAPAQQQALESELDVNWKASGTILLVDDEDALRSLGKRMLERIGFTVISARDGREALTIYREKTSEIACVLLDLTMPHLDGEETFRELRRINAGVNVILTSGYNEQDVVQRFSGKGLIGFIQKPYKMSNLLEQFKPLFHEKLADVTKEE